MKILVERSDPNGKCIPWIRVKVTNSNGVLGCPVVLHKYITTTNVSVVGYYTERNFNYKEKTFADYEEAWRFMWRKAMKWSQSI